MPNMDPNDIANAVYYVVHVVQDTGDQSATFRVGILPPKDGQPAKDPDDVPDGPVRMCLAQGMVPPFNVKMFGPMDERMSHLMFALFDGVKATDAEHQKMIEKLNKADPKGAWMNMRMNPN